MKSLTPHIAVIALAAASSRPSYVASGFSPMITGTPAPIARSDQAPPDGAVVYRESCARCHDDPQGRTPAREALRALPADAILVSLNGGSMAMMAQTLSLAEKRAVAEYLAGKPTATSAPALAGLC